MGVLDTTALAAWWERAHVRGSFAGYLGVRTLAGYFLLAQDADGAYLTGFSWLFMFDPMPSPPPARGHPASNRCVQVASWRTVGCQYFA